MTNLQMQYTDLLEKQRHNRATEEIDASDVAEKVRHNVTSEELTRAQQDLDKYMNDSKLLNNLEIQKMKNAAEIQLQSMKNDISEKQLLQRERELNQAFDKYNRELIIAQQNADTSRMTGEASAEMNRAKAHKDELDAQANLKGRITKALTSRPAVTVAAQANQVMSQPGYKTARKIATMASTAVKNRVDELRSGASRGAGHYR